MQIPPKSFAFTLLLGLLAALPALSIDISAPTLALLPLALDTSQMTAGLTLSMFMVGFAAGQFGAGTLSDRTGRRPVLLAGLACFSIAGAACMASPTGAALVVFRMIQGVGAGACSVVSFAMVQDLFAGDELRAKRAYVTVVFGAVPILAPALGSLLMAVEGWRAVHGVLSVAGFALLLVVWVGGGESRSERAGERRTVPVARTRLADDRRFVGLAGANALSYGAIFAYIAGAPVIMVGQMGYPPATFAAVFAGTAVALTSGAWASARLCRRGVPAPMLLNASLSAAGLATLLLAALCVFEATTALLIVPLLLVLLFTRGVTAPNLQHLAIDRQRHRAGAASAVVGVSQLLSGAAASAVVAALLPILGIGAVAYPMAGLSAAALLCWRLAGDERLSTSPQLSVGLPANQSIFSPANEA